MAAPCRSLLRSIREDAPLRRALIFRILGKADRLTQARGIQYFSSRNVWLKVTDAPSFRTQRCVFQSRALQCSSSRLLNSTKTHTTENTSPTNDRADYERRAEQEQEDSGPEYIPKRKAKNPMIVIGYAWMVGLPTGIIGFILAKRQVDKNRLQQLKIRQRMKKSNEGEYDHERYRSAARTQ